MMMQRWLCVEQRSHGKKTGRPFLSISAARRERLFLEEEVSGCRDIVGRKTATNCYKRNAGDSDIISFRDEARLKGGWCYEHGHETVRPEAIGQ